MEGFDRIDTFWSPDGLRLRWALRNAAAGQPRGTVLLLNGRTEFIEKFGETAEVLSGRRFTVLTLDWRGQGGSSRLLCNPHKGHVDRFEDYIADLDRFVHRVAAPIRRPPYLLLGHSMGGHLGLHYLARRPDLFRGAVLTAPMVDIQLNPMLRRSLPLFCRCALVCGTREAYVPGTGDYGRRERRYEGNPLTSDRRRFDRTVGLVERNPALAVGGVTFGWLDAAFRSIGALNGAGGVESIETPCLVVSPGEDRVVSVAAQEAFCRRSRVSRLERLEGARHEVLMETDAILRRFWEVFDRFTSGG